jgi:hypothetical protein
MIAGGRRKVNGREEVAHEVLTIRWAVEYDEPAPAGAAAEGGKVITSANRRLGARINRSCSEL